MNRGGTTFTRRCSTPVCTSCSPTSIAHGDPDRIFLPYRIDRVRFYRRPTQNVWSHVRVTRNDEDYLTSDTLVFDEAGELVAEVLGLTCKRLVGAGSRQTDAVYEGCYEYRWVPAPRDAELHGRIFDYHQRRSDRRCVRMSLTNWRPRLAAEGIPPRLIRIEPHGVFRRTAGGRAVGPADADRVRSRVDSRATPAGKALPTAPTFRRCCNSLRRCTSERVCRDSVRGHQRRGGCGRRPAAGFGAGDSARHGTRHQQRMPQHSADGDRSECSDPTGRSRLRL